MSDVESVVARYLAIWNTLDADERRAAMRDVLTDDVSYIDLLGAAEGADELNALIGRSQKRFTGARLARGGLVDAHHDQGRFTWIAGYPGAEPMFEGFDVIEMTGEGRIH